MQTWFHGSQRCALVDDQVIDNETSRRGARWERSRAGIHPRTRRRQMQTWFRYSQRSAPSVEQVEVEQVEETS
jgi:hypothetical protein